MVQSFRHIIGLWPSPDALAVDIGAKVETVRKWRQRDSIPADRWLAVIDAAKARGEIISSDDMAALAARSPEIAE